MKGQADGRLSWYNNCLECGEGSRAYSAGDTGLLEKYKEAGFDPAAGVTRAARGRLDPCVDPSSLNTRREGADGPATARELNFRQIEQEARNAEVVRCAGSM